MRRDRRGKGGLWWVPIIGIAASFIVFIILLGPGRAVRIAVASFLSTAVDGLAEDPGPHRLRVLDVHIEPACLDTLNGDLPWSGGRTMPAIVVDHGVQHKVKFRYRGFWPTHFLGGKKSFRLSTKQSGPFAPYRKVNVINPKSLDLLGNHMGNWIAGTMGVPVPYDEMVFVRLNDRDLGVMELYEQVDGTFEQVRGLANGEVPVYRGDFPPPQGRDLPEKRLVWSNAAYWEYVSDADSTQAHTRLKALISVVRDSTLTILQRRDTLAQLIDVDAYMRYMAALVVVNTKHMDQYHNKWLVMRPDGRFYPVWWDPLLMFPPDGEPLYYIHDALSFWLLQVPEWRLQRDRYAYEAVRELHTNGAFTRQLDGAVQRMMPSVLADRNKFGMVSEASEDVHRNSVVHVIGSLAKMRARVAAYWDRTLARFEANAITIDRTTGLHIRSTSEAAVQLSWTIAGPTDTEVVQVNGEVVQPLNDGDKRTLILHRTLKLPAGALNTPFADWQHYTVLPLDATVSFPQGSPAGLTITNAITDGPIR